MPRGDATGPVGMGRMTGGAAGFCAGYNMPGYMNTTPASGCKMGFGRKGGFGVGGFGRRNRFFAAGGMGPGRAWASRWTAPLADPEAGKQSLKSQAECLQSEMDAIKKRLDELAAKNQTK